MAFGLVLFLAGVFGVTYMVGMWLQERFPRDEDEVREFHMGGGL